MPTPPTTDAIRRHLGDEYGLTGQLSIEPIAEGRADNFLRVAGPAAVAFLISGVPVGRYQFVVDVSRPKGGRIAKVVQFEVAEVDLGRAGLDLGTIEIDPAGTNPIQAH
jgi:hypothetical protein